MDSMFEVLYVLRRRVTSSIGWLIVGTFCLRALSIASDHQTRSGPTIAVDRTVSTRLLPIAFDLFSSTLVARSRHSSPLLEMCALRRRSLAWTTGGCRWGSLRRLLLELLLLSHRVATVTVIFWRRRLHDYTSSFSRNQRPVHSALERVKKKPR